MTEKKKPSLRETVLFVIAIMMFLVAFTDIRYQDVISWWNQQFYPEPIAIISSWDVPERYYNPIYEISPEYYIEQKIEFTSETISYDQDLKFKISISNKGKRDPQEPRLVIFVLDPFSQVWAGFNLTLDEEIMSKKIFLQYELPTEDKKNLGAWRLISLLFDDSNLSLTSSTSIPFEVTEKVLPSWIRIAVVLGTIPIFFFIIPKTMDKILEFKYPKKKA